MAAPAGIVTGNLRTARKAAIRRGSRAARRALRAQEPGAIADLRGVYQRARDDIQADILAMGDDGGTLRLQVLQSLKTQIDGRLQQLAAARNGLLDRHLATAAQSGAGAFGSALAQTELTRIAEDAANFTRNLVAHDGLQLSDRLWRLDNHATQAVGEIVQTHIIQGHSADRAALDFLSRGEPIPAALANKIDQAQAGRVAKVAAGALMTGEGDPYHNAIRLFRTEINRAHGEAYQAAAFAVPDVIGTRFLLSPRHPQRDICDMHAHVNRYGLGPGVYPKGRNPWPAHPNTLSFTEAVFSDEVSATDRQGKQDRIAWLKDQPPGTQITVLGGVKKYQAFQAGFIGERSIATPWRVLKARVIKQGFNAEDKT